jgi:hypothetical protein
VDDQFVFCGGGGGGGGGRRDGSTCSVCSKSETINTSRNRQVDRCVLWMGGRRRSRGRRRRYCC